MKKLLVIVSAVCCFGIVGYNCATNQQQDPEYVHISEKCHKNWQQISEDTAKLKYYFRGVFMTMAERNDPQYKPSDILIFMRDKSDINKETQLHYMPATAYMHNFIEDKQYAEMDALFTEKYNETQNLLTTWKWFDGHFAQKILKEPIGNFCKEMIESDATLVELSKQGVHFADNGRTVVMNGMSEKPEDVAAVKKAIEQLCKK